MTIINHDGYPVPISKERDPAEELQELHDIYGNGNMLHSPDRVMAENLDARQALDWLANQVAKSKLEGKYTALVAGGFDVPHDNHEWYIRDCRARVAKHLLESRGQDPTANAIMEVMTSDQISLIVSMDSDAMLNERKGGQADKGGIERPVYPWIARAHRLAGYSFQHPKNGELHHSADIVSRECTIDYKDTPLEETSELASYLKSLSLLDGYIVFDEHPQDEISAKELGFDPIVVPQAVVYARDPRTGAEYKSSGIIKKIRGEV